MTSKQHLLIFSDDRWSLDRDSIAGTTPGRWWTITKDSFEAMPDGSVKEAHMPCALLFQVGESDNQNVLCNSIEVNGSTAIMQGRSTVSRKKGQVAPKTYTFTVGDLYTYPYNMKDGNPYVTTLPDPNDMGYVIDGIVNEPKDSGKFVIKAMVSDDVDATQVTEALNFLNVGDVGNALSMAAEGVESPTYDPSSENPTTVPASPSGYEPAEMAAEDANIAPLDGPQGVGSGSPTAIGEGHGVTESFGKSTAPVPGTLLSAEGDDPSAAGGPGPSPLDAPATPSDYELTDLDSQIDAWMAETATHDPYSDEVPYEGPGEFSGSEVSFDAEPRALGKDIKRPGALTRKAKRAGMSVSDFAKHVMANPSKFSKLTRQQAQFYNNILSKGSKTSASRAPVRADYRRKGYMLAESQVTWEDGQGLSSPSSPPEGVFMADEAVDEIYGTGHIIGQTGSTWTTSPLAAESNFSGHTKDQVTFIKRKGYQPDMVCSDCFSCFKDGEHSCQSGGICGCSWEEVDEYDAEGDEYASGYGENSAWPSSQGVPVWYGSAETFCADCGEYEAECGCYAAEVDVPFVGSTDVRSAVVGMGLGVGLMALLARYRR
jgi:hypothetical protein